MQYPTASTHKIVYTQGQKTILLVPDKLSQKWSVKGMVEMQ